MFRFIIVKDDEVIFTDFLQAEMINRYEIFRACDARGRDKNKYVIWSEKRKRLPSRSSIRCEYNIKRFPTKSDTYCFQVLQEGYGFCEGDSGILVYRKAGDVLNSFRHGFHDRS
jgi:hypothetical protein